MDKNLLLFGDLLDATLLGRIETTWQEGGLLDPDWENIPVHMTAVASIGLPIVNLTRFSTPQNVAMAALIHDAGKRREREAVKAVEAQGGDVAAEYDRQAKAQEDFLHKMGWPDDIIEASQSVGHTSLREFLEWKDISDLRKIIHLADDLTAGSIFPNLAYRMAANRIRYPEIDQQGQARYKLPGNTFDVMERIARELLQYFARAASFSEEDFHQAIVKQAKARLAG